LCSFFFFFFFVLFFFFFCCSIGLIGFFSFSFLFNVFFPPGLPGAKKKKKKKKKTSLRNSFLHELILYNGGVSS